MHKKMMVSLCTVALLTKDIEFLQFFFYLAYVFRFLYALCVRTHSFKKGGGIQGMMVKTGFSWRRKIKSK